VAASPGTGALGPAASGAPGDLGGGSRDAGGIKSLAPEQGVIGGLSASSLLAVGGAIVFLAGALLVAVRLASRRLA
jgi:hypothetical protein